MKARTNTERKQRRQQGMTVVLTAVFIFALFAFAALAVDLGVAYTARTSAQHAADAAALAGSFTFVTNPTAVNPVNLAGDAAVTVAAQNQVMGKSVVIPLAAISAGPPCPAGTGSSWVCVDQVRHRVTVNVGLSGANSIGTYFARAWGWSQLSVASMATAEAPPQASATNCLRPFFMPNSAVAPAGTSACTAKTTKQTVLDASTSPMQLTPYALNQMNSASGAVVSMWGSSNSGGGNGNSGGNGNGNSGNGNGTGGSGASSQWQLIDFSGSPQVLACTIDHCLQECGVNPTVACNQSLGVWTGQKTGLVESPLCTEIGSSGGPSSGCSALDRYNAPGDYGGNHSQTSPSVILVIVWDDCAQPIDNGKQQTINVIGFANVFVQEVAKGKGTWGYLVGGNGCGGTNSGVGPFAVPVRLIQKPY